MTVHLHWKNCLTFAVDQVDWTLDTFSHNEDISSNFRSSSARPWSSFAKRPPAPLSPKLEQLPAHCHRRGGGVPEPCHQLLHFHHVANEGGTRKFEKIGLENMECSSARPNTRNLAKLEQLPAHCHRGGGGVPTPNVLRQNGTRFCIFTM